MDSNTQKEELVSYVCPVCHKKTTATKRPDGANDGADDGSDDVY